MNATRNYFSASGAQLRALAAAGDADAIAEQQARAAKRAATGVWTVAAAKSQGRDDIVASKLANAGAKPKAAAQPMFTRTAELVVARAHHASVAGLRAEIAPRLDGLEAAMVGLAGQMASLTEVVTVLAKARMATVKPAKKAA